MSYSAKSIANYFLELAEKHNAELTPMKLQKLVYYAHGWNLAITQEPLINEQIEAWSYGPVIPSLYHEFKEFGNQAIDRPAVNFDWNSQGYSQSVPTIDKEESGEKIRFTRDLLNKIWAVYGEYTPFQLSNLTHEPGTPWDQVSKMYNGHLPRATDIPRDLIREYFLNQA